MRLAPGRTSSNPRVLLKHTNSGGKNGLKQLCRGSCRVLLLFGFGSKSLSHHYCQSFVSFIKNTSLKPTYLDLKNVFKLTPT